MAREILCFRSCKRCHRPFWYCHGREPGRRYCQECSPRAKEEREKKARRNYRDSPEGREQHSDEEDRRRKKVRELSVRMGDRRRATEMDELRSPATTAASERAVEEAEDVPKEEGDRVEWVLVAWPGLLSAAAALLGAELACPFSGLVGRVVEVVGVGEMRGFHLRADEEPPWR